MLSILHSFALMACGTWLLLYKLAMWTPLGVAIPSTITTAVAGLPLALLSPLFPWPPEPFQMVTLAIIGLLLSFCSPILTAVILAMSLGFSIGGFVWQAKVCAALPELYGFGLHGTLLTVCVLICIGVFILLPGFAGPKAVVYVLVPTTGALMLVLGAADSYPGQGLDAKQLLAISPCGAGSAAVLHTLGAWLALTLCGMVLQVFLNRCGGKVLEDDEEEDDDSLVATLLPVGGKEEGGGASLPRPGEAADGGNRFKMITSAIYADEGTDQSHLTDNEKKLVAVCRKDDFERDRVIWGGGLI